MKKTLIFAILGWVGLWTVFFIVGSRNLDPDFGWHLRVGELLMTSGIPKTDPYSYTMPSFPWVDHGRLSDVAIAWLYMKIGNIGLAAVFAGIVTLALMLLVPISQWGLAAVPILLGGGVLVARAGVRPQVEDWLGFSLVYRYLNDEQWWNKHKWLLPVVFGIWANFHGGFVIGLAILGTGIAVKWWAGERRRVRDVMLWVLCAVATTVNPYGVRLWHEVGLTMTDTYLKQHVSEWKPFYTMVEISFWLSAGWCMTLLSKYGKRTKRWQLAVGAGTMLAGLSSLRHMAFFVLAAIPMSVGWLEMVRDDVKADKEALARARIFYILLVTVAGVVFLADGGLNVWRLFNHRGFSYPEKAVEYLNTNKVEGNLFADYGWGGYLIWKMPGKKVFVDGRMPSWRWSAPAGESDWAFKEFNKAADGEFEEIFAKYGVKAVLWRKEIKTEDLKEWEWLTKLVIGKKKISPLGEKLLEKGWTRVYEDELSAIYREQP